MSEQRDVTARGFSKGDQVKIVAMRHPWQGAIGRLMGPFAGSSEHWVIQLDTDSPGHQAMAHDSEIRRV